MTFRKGQSGNPDAGKPLVERFASKVTHTATCWLWTGARIESGYGVIWSGGRNVFAHRAAWEFANGPIPEGVCVLHRCDNPSCVNPDHLFLGSKGDNNKDRAKKDRSSKGIHRWCAKLTDEKVRQIRASNKSPTELARLHGVSRAAIYSAKERITWRHV